MINSATFCCSILAQSSALERWQFARRRPDASYGWTWLVTALGITLVLLVTRYIIVRMRRNQQKKMNWLRFEPMAEERGLSPREINLLGSVINLCGLSNEPQAIVNMETIFVAATTKYMEIVHEHLDSPRTLEELERSLGIIRAKLGFGSPEDDDPTSSRKLPLGTKLTIILQSEPHDVKGKVTKNDRDRLVVETDTPVKIDSKEPLLVRFFDAKSVWEFDAPVISQDGKKLSLRHAGKMRYVNLRRFSRVPVKLKALVAPFAFRSLSYRLGHLKYTEATVTELAGPGLQLRGPFKVQQGDQILVIFEIAQGKVVQAIAKVKQVHNPERIFKIIGVELQGLSEAEVADLISLTNNTEIVEQHKVFEELDEIIEQVNPSP